MTHAKAHDSFVSVSMVMVGVLVVGSGMTSRMTLIFLDLSVTGFKMQVNILESIPY